MRKNKKIVILTGVFLITLNIAACGQVKEVEIINKDKSVMGQQESNVQAVENINSETKISVNDSYYSSATDISFTEVGNYAAYIKQLFMEHDWLTISTEISYPITISGTTYSDSAAFLDASNNFDSNLNEKFFSYLEEEDCVEMFVNSQGIMLGETGQIWIADVLDDKSNSHGLKILAINDLLSEESSNGIEGQASLYRGEGYSLYVPDDDWTMFVPGSWHAVENQQIRFWISSYAGLNKGQVERILAGQGYQADESGLWKQEGDTLYRVQCVETEKDVWTLDSVIQPCETQEDWEEALQAIFATFEVEEGYDVGSTIPRAVMPEGKHLQLYETTYADETSRAWALQDPDYAGSYIYDELTICNVTDSAFDFMVVRRNYETDEGETVIPQGTAHINEDGISATFEGLDYTLTFDFSDIANPLPVVRSIKLWGVGALEGIRFSSNDIPGYEAG